MTQSILRRPSRDLEQVADFIYTSASQITVPASSILVGTQGRLDDAALLSAGALVFDFANGTGDNGLDAGAEASNQWYALYAVPGVGSTYKLKASTNLPHTAGGTGPAGFTRYRYLGVFRNGGQGAIINDIVPFTKSGKMVRFLNLLGQAAVGIILVNAGGSDSNWVRAVSMSGAAVPFSSAMHTFYGITSQSSSRILIAIRDASNNALGSVNSTSISGTGAEVEARFPLDAQVNNVRIFSDSAGTKILSLVGLEDPYLL